MKIVFVINSLSIGGAEKMLLRLVKTSSFQKQQLTVISLLPSGTLFKDFSSCTNVYTFNFGNPFRALIGFFQLFFLIRDLKPDVVHSWLYQSDLISGVIAKSLGVKVIIWSIRQTNLDLRYNKISTLVAAKLCALFSYIVPDVIISNSCSGRLSHIDFNYQKAKIKVIQNGIDLDRISAISNPKKLLKNEIGIDTDVPLIGMIARFDPQKDHQTFLNAAVLILKQHPKTHFLLCGQGVDYSNKTLIHEIQSLGLKSNFTLLGLHADIEHISSSLDIHVLCSFGEGWPNVIGEMMAAGVLCVSTDVGESSSIMGNIGITVPVGDAEGVFNAVSQLLLLEDSEKKNLRQRGRNRIENLYEISKIADQYLRVYSEL